MIIRMYPTGKLASVGADPLPTLIMAANGRLRIII